MPAAFDLAAGELAFDDGSVVVHPGLTGSGSVRHDGAIEGEPFLVVLTFDDSGRLRRADLVATHPRFGTSWDDADPPSQRAFHDEWLTARLGADGAEPWNPGSYPFGGVEWRFGWGTVGSYMHPQDSSPAIILDYTPRLGGGLDLVGWLRGLFRR